MSIAYALFGLFIFIGFTTEVATGFGSIIIAISLGALILPIEAMLPILVCLNCMMNGVFLSRIYQQIHYPTLLKIILPLMMIGMVLGILLLPFISDTWLKKGFATLVIWFATKELYKMYRGNPLSSQGSLQQKVWTLLGGVTHGLYASGGPLLVYSLTGNSLPKSHFRATLLATWFILNACYALFLLANGVLGQYSIQIMSYSPVLLLSVLMGQYLHQKINEQRFKQVVYILLIASAVAMLF